MPLPELLFLPSNCCGKPYLYLHEDGKDIDAEKGGDIEQLVKEGHIVLAIDLIGYGEIQTKPWRYVSSAFLGNNLPEFFISYVLGKSLLGMRLEDILVATQFVEEQYYKKSGNLEKVSVVEVGNTGLPALHAVALEKDRFHSLKLHNTLASWSDIINTDVPKNVLDNIVHGALKVYDLPDLISLIEESENNIEVIESENTN